MTILLPVTQPKRFRADLVALAGAGVGLAALTGVLVAIDAKSRWP